MKPKFSQGHQGGSFRGDFLNETPIVYRDYNEEAKMAHIDKKEEAQFDSTEHIEAQHEHKQKDDGLYEQAMERLLSLRSVIETQYPRMKDVRKRISDVKYYFDLA